MNAHIAPGAAGLILALMVGAAGTMTGLDRDRALYPVILIVIAALYGLFAAIDGSAVVIVREAALILPFVAIALAGFKRSLWLIVAALLGHGMYDLLHARIVANAGVPSWWPVFCLAYDVTAAFYLAYMLRMAKKDGSKRSR